MRFFFDIYNGRDLIRDGVGRELVDVATARIEAIEDAKELIAGAIFRADGLERGEMRVRDDTPMAGGFTISFKDVIGGLRA